MRFVGFRHPEVPDVFWESHFVQDLSHLRRKAMSLFDQVKHLANGAQTIKEWLGDGGITVHQSDAQRRADVCLRGGPDGKPCPNNQQTAPITSVVGAAIKRHLELKSKLMLRTQGEKSLHSCSACGGCPLRLKVWVPQDIVTRSITDEERQNFPGYCWQIKPA